MIDTMREFSTFFRRDQIEAYQKGVISYRYRGVPCLKSPIDVAIYLRLLWDLKPATIFEIGSHSGGSALMLRDIMKSFDINCRVVSIDLKPPTAPISGIEFLQGDVRALDDVFARVCLNTSPHPWLAIEDSAHDAQSCAAALRFFANSLLPGEFLVIEDGVLDELGMSARYSGGPNTAIAAFFETDPEVFEVATEYCDMFGCNATYNPNGYLRKR
jgi:cephalosporin hydroxylase